MYTRHRWAGSCLEEAVRKYSPHADLMQRRDRRHVWLEMKRRGFKIVGPESSVDHIGRRHEWWLKWKEFAP